MNQDIPAWFLDKVNGIESKVDALLHRFDVHESNHHGRHGRGPGRVINRQNAQTLGLVALMVVEVLRVL